MTGGNRSKLDEIEMVLSGVTGQHTVFIDVYDSSLSRKWLSALDHLLSNQYHLEKNYCFVGFEQSARNAEFICNRINESIAAINQANLGYTISDIFSVSNTITTGPIGDGLPGCKMVQDRMNQLHRYFEDLQGVSGAMSPFYTAAGPDVRWHIRQLNLLCHEYESLVQSMRKAAHAPEWRRPSQLMCWLNAPRFVLDQNDYELFGVETLCRPPGGVFVGVNKAVGKHHWEVFQDEGKNVDQLTTTALRSQTEAAGDFDIEWAANTAGFPWMESQLAEFRTWLLDNGFDPADKSLTIGHPQVAQVDLMRSFGTTDTKLIWQILNSHLDVAAVKTSRASAKFDYHWSDLDYAAQQIRILSQNV